MTAAACSKSKLVDAHFAKTITPEDERELRAHLPSCSACHERYRRRLLLAKLDPEAPSAEDRIAKGLGFSSPVPASAPKRSVVPLRVAAVATALALAAALLLRATTNPEGDGFTARGPGAVSAESSVQVFRAPRGGEPALAQGSVRADDELAFAYDNVTKKPYLLVFGVDEHGHVFWYHPAWTNASEDPSAIRIDTTGGRHELREAISHDLDGKDLEIHALFSDRSLTVREVERLLANRKAPVGRLDSPGIEDYVVRLAVAR